jgi:Tol biopolymer transport system component
VGPNTLWQIPLVGLADTTATQYLSAYDLRHMDYPRFSPDGSLLALRSAYALVLIDLDAQTARRLPDSTMDNTPPVWSPAGFQSEADCPSD